MHPADKHHADDNQSPKTFPTILKESISINVQYIFNRRESHSCNAGIDDAIQDRVEFMPKEREDHQNSQTFQSLFNDRRNDGGRPEFSRDFRTCQHVNSDPEYRVQNESTSTCDDHSPQERCAQQKFWFLFVAIEPVDECRQQEHGHEPKEKRSKQCHKTSSL